MAWVCEVMVRRMGFLEEGFVCTAASSCKATVAGTYVRSFSVLWGGSMQGCCVIYKDKMFTQIVYQQAMSLSRRLS